MKNARGAGTEMTSMKCVEEARDKIRQSAELVRQPSPQALTQCLPLLEGAASELREFTGEDGIAAQRRADVLRRLLSLRKDLDRLRALLCHAAAFHEGWRRVRDARTGGYDSDGEPKAPGPHKRVLAEG